MTEWYYADRQGQQRGPVQTEDLLALHGTGQVGMETLVWRNGMANWQAFSTVANEVMPPPPSAQPASPSQGMSMYEMATPAAPTSEAAAPVPAPGTAPVVDGSYSMYAAAAPVAQANDPYAAPRAQVGGGHGVQHGGHVVYAGFWKRVAATFIDAFALGIPMAILMGIIGAVLGINGSFSFRGNAFDHPGLTLFSYLLAATIYGWFYSNTSMMATPGKLAIGIKVVRTNGEPISFLRGFARYWASFLSAIVLGIGYLMAAFTDRKQALHDTVCDTLVVDKWAYTDHPEWQDETLGTVTKIVLGLGIVLIVGVFFVMCSVAASLAGR